MHAALGPLILVVGLLGGFGVPLGVPPMPETQLLSKIAPEQCLFYFSSSGMASPDPKSTNQAEQLLAEPDVQKSFAQIEKLIRTSLGKSMRPGDLPPGVATDDIVDLAKLALSRPMAIYISDVQINPDGPSFHGAIAIRLADDAEKIKAKLDQMLSNTVPPPMLGAVDINGEKWQTVKPAPNVTIVWGLKKNFFIAALGQDEMEALLKRASGKAPEWLAKVRQDLPLQRVSTVGYINVKAILKIALPIAGPQAATALDAIGISNINNIASVAGLDQNSYASKMLISIDGPPQGLMRFATVKPLAAGDLAAISAEAGSVIAASIDPASVFDTYMATAEKIDPQGAAAMQRNVAAVEAQFGLKLRDDILAPFGGAMSFCSSVSPSGMPEMTLAIAVKDPQKAAASFSKIIQIVQAQLQTAEQLQARALGSPVPFKLEKSNIDEKDVYTITLQQPGMPPVHLSWCLTDKELVVSASPQSLQAHFTQPSGFKPLSQSPDVAKLFAEPRGPTALVYNNLQQTCDFIYAALPVYSMLAQQQGVRLDMSIVPPKEAIKGHLTPLVATARQTPSGIEIVERTPIPGLGITQSTPVLTALLLPAVQASREAARRASSINNMKQIMLAMHNYHDANKRFPPAFKADKDGKPLLSWRVLILPFLEDGDLYKQFHLDEPWDSENNKKLIARMPSVYRSPNSQAIDGKTNYLTVRGENAVFPGKQGVRMADITDGTAFTIALVEASDEKAVIWTKPDDFEVDAANPLKGLPGLHPSVFLAAFADGSVRSLPITIDPETLKGLFSRNGGEAVKLP